MKNNLRFVNLEILLKNTSHKKLDTIFLIITRTLKKFGLLNKLECYTYKHDY